MEAARAMRPSMHETRVGLVAGGASLRVGLIISLLLTAAARGENEPAGTLHEAAANTALALDFDAPTADPSTTQAADYIETFLPATAEEAAGEVTQPVETPPVDAPPVESPAPPVDPIAAAEEEFVGPPVTKASTILPPIAPIEPIQSITIPRPGQANSRRPAGARDAAASSSRSSANAGRQVPWYRSPWVALALVLALIYAGMRLLRRHLPAAGAPATQAVKVLGRTPLGPKQAALLLHVGPRVVLVGQSGERLSTLCAFTDPADVAVLLGRTVSPPEPQDADFANHLAGQFDAYDEALAADAVDDAPADDLATADETLQQASGQLTNLVNRLRALQVDAR